MAPNEQARKNHDALFPAHICTRQSTGRQAGQECQAYAASKRETVARREVQDI
jgi:hypothetical protein